MTFKEIQDLIRLVNKTDLTELKVKDGEFEISIRTKKFAKAMKQEFISAPQQMMALPSQTAAPLATPEVAAPSKDKPAATEPDTSNLLEVKSPIVGTFYRSSSPDKPAFIKVGDEIAAGDVVCIVEAMKLFNEIESEVSGKVVKVCIEDASPVEYDQVLFLVEPA